MKEHCGVIAIYSLEGKNVIPMLLNGLRSLQHRGQESWGIAFRNGNFKKMGLVTDGFEDTISKLKRFYSNYGIGHVRYSTYSSTDLNGAQPIDLGYFTMAHNGTIENADLLMNASIKSDTEAVGRLLLNELKSNKWDWVGAFKKIGKMLNGSYNFVFLTKKGEIYAVRDDRGFRPMSVGWHEETRSYIVASESCAISLLGGKLIRDVRPGEVIKLGKDGMNSFTFSSPKKAFCSFEYIYFAHPSSVIEGVSVYEARKRIGVELAKKYSIDADVVIPVPDSARPAALGYSMSSGIPFEEGLVKDRYSKKGSWRSFIQPSQKDRDEINMWMIPIERTIKGRNVVIIDDSIVRGTSSRSIIRMLRRVGAKSISLLVTFPPIIYPCYMGIDFPTQNELLAYRAGGEGLEIKEVGKRVAKLLNADFIGYNDPETLSKAIGLKLGDMCMACVTGDYSCVSSKPRFRKMKRGF